MEPRGAVTPQRKSYLSFNRIRRKHGGKDVEDGTHPKEVFQCSSQNGGGDGEDPATGTSQETEGDGDDRPPG